MSQPSRGISSKLGLWQENLRLMSFFPPGKSCLRCSLINAMGKAVLQQLARAKSETQQINPPSFALHHPKPTLVQAVMRNLVRVVEGILWPMSLCWHRLWIL